jgi:hypothetical protein
MDITNQKEPDILPDGRNNRPLKKPIEEVPDYEEYLEILCIETYFSY